MNKLITFLPNILVTILFLGVGAYTKFTGAESAVEVFTTLNLLDIPEQYVRYIIGGLQVLLGLGILSSKERTYAFINTVGLGIALYYHYTTLGFDSSLYIIVGLLANLAILFKKRKKEA